ncbi:MAG: hypothetical protein GAK31_03378 [Stenotrophomonas maltophilia]|uniref:Transmembrane protein n=1 Tax=Stenotrophomonas maltophilia TaxID=40324 RepID=A0A7V8FDH2_STEMA|nr:MAG: hypothetical protein GAK31_03378 [Stenotrophomonas maltophilia]
MKSGMDDPLKVPGLQARVEAVPGLRAPYRRGSFARTLGLARFPLLLPVMVLAFVLKGGITSSPTWAHVPPGFGGGSPVGDMAMVFLVMGIPLLVWVGFGLRNVLRNRGVHHFTFSFVIGGTLLAGMLGVTGIASADLDDAAARVGHGERLQYSKLDSLVDGPQFANFSPGWQAYLKAQQTLAQASLPLNGAGHAVARGLDIGVAVPPAVQARFEAKAGLPHAAHTRAWLGEHRLRLGLFGVLGTLAGWLLLLLLVLGTGLTVLGYHVRGRARVINGQLQQLQPPPL